MVHVTGGFWSTAHVLAFSVPRSDSMSPWQIDWKLHRKPWKINLFAICLHPGRWTWNLKMMVWFRWLSFSGARILRFQPWIFRGLQNLTTSTRIHQCKWWFSAVIQLESCSHLATFQGSKSLTKIPKAWNRPGTNSKSPLKNRATFPKGKESFLPLPAFFMGFSS